MLSIESKSFLKRRSPVLDPFSEALRELIDVAESAQAALAERDLTAVGCVEGQQITEWEDLEDHVSGSGSSHHDAPHDSDASSRV